MSSLKKILETIKNIYAKITNLEDKTAETEWITCTMNSGFTNGALASAGDLMYKKDGSRVYIKGSCSGFKSGSTVCTQLPEGYRPPSRIDFFVGTSSNRVAKAMISSAGNLMLLGDTGVNGEDFSSTQWYSFCTSFLIN